MSDPQRTRAPWRLEIECYKGCWQLSSRGWEPEYHWVTMGEYDTHSEAEAAMAQLRRGDPTRKWIRSHSIIRL